MNRASGLAVGRIVIGVGAWLAPGATGKLFGIGGGPDTHLTSRLFGARDFALGAGQLANEGEALRAIMTIGLASDFLDLLAAVVGYKQKSLSTSSAALTALVAGGAVVVGAMERSKVES